MMHRIGSGGLLALVLGAVVVLLVGLVGLQLTAARDEPVALSSASGDLPDLPDVLNLPALAYDDYGEIAERPVFSPSRRPVAEVAAVPRTVPSQGRPPVFELVGVVTADERQLALVSPRGSQETVRLAEGEDYRGWTIVEIGTSHVVVSSGGTEQRLELAFRPR